MKNYQVTVSRQGVKLTTVNAVAKDSTQAIEQVESEMKLSVQAVKLEGMTKAANWSGFEFCARVI